MSLDHKIGIVSDWKPGFAKVYFEDDDLPTDWWPIILPTTLKDFVSYPLNVNEQVVCLVDKQLEEGYIVGAIHSNPDPPDPGAGAGKFRKVFEDGTFLEYDKGAHKLTANVQGSVEVDATGDITATSETNISATATIQAKIQAPDIQLMGNVTVTGVISAGGISAAPMAGVSGADGKINASADITTTGTLTGNAVKAGAVDLSTHTHSGVQTGSGVSGPPV